MGSPSCADAWTTPGGSFSLRRRRCLGRLARVLDLPESAMIPVGHRRAVLRRDRLGGMLNYFYRAAA